MEFEKDKVETPGPRALRDRPFIEPRSPLRDYVPYSDPGSFQDTMDRGAPEGKDKPSDTKEDKNKKRIVVVPSSDDKRFTALEIIGAGAFAIGAAVVLTGTSWAWGPPLAAGGAAAFILTIIKPAKNPTPAEKPPA